MSKIITFIIIFILTSIASAQNTTESIAIKKTIKSFFDGLHKGDSALVSSTLHSTIKIQTTFTDKSGKKTLVTDNKEKLLTGIANKKSEHTYLEKILSWQIQIDGNLASVWTPYQFYLNEEFSHCGANSFQLFNDNGSWKIIYLVDMRRKNDCKPLKK